MNRDRAKGAAIVVLFAATCMLVTACGVKSDSLEAGSGASTTQTTAAGNGNAPQITVATTPSTTEPEPVSTSDLEAVATNVQAFWTEELPKIYKDDYQPLPADRIIAGTPDATYPVCDGKPLKYSDVEGNAFAAPCSEGPTVVWDAADLIPGIDEKYGPVAAAIVLAHEWGHIAQFEAGVDASTVILEQQADCFAGAWLNHLIEDPGNLAQLAKANALDSAVSSIIEFRDAPGSTPEDPGAHGTGFDRVRALQEGYTKGDEYCARYPDTPPPLIRLDLASASDEDPDATGNLSLADLTPLVVDDLNAFYDQIITDFRGATADAVLSDPDAKATLEGLATRIGDGGAGVVLGMIWASFAQQQVDGGEGRDAEGRLQQQACMSGGWLANVYNDTGNQDRNLQLTAGDLDEAILGLIDLGGNQGANKDTNGEVFQLVASLRQGVVEGFGSCKLGE